MTTQNETGSSSCPPPDPAAASGAAQAKSVPDPALAEPEPSEEAANELLYEPEPTEEERRRPFWRRRQKEIVEPSEEAANESIFDSESESAPARPIWQYSSDLAKWITAVVAILAAAAITIFAIVRATNTREVGTQSNAAQVSLASNTTRANLAASIFSRASGLHINSLRQLDHTIWYVGVSMGENRRTYRCFVFDTAQFGTYLTRASGAFAEVTCSDSLRH